MSNEIQNPPITEHRALSQEALFERFHGTGSSSRHLLTVYSLVIGTNARTIMDIGLGQTTGAIRAAAKRTGGVVYSCDFDKRRYTPLLEEQDEHWKLFLEASGSFIPKVPDPLDFVMHDGAHDYTTVLNDLKAILPKMRKFGIICVHDTQQIDLNKEMLSAIKDSTTDYAVSLVNLPFAAGLAIIRVEESLHPPITPAGGKMPDGRSETGLMEYPMVTISDVKYSATKGKLAALRSKAGRVLRHTGLKH